MLDHKTLIGRLTEWEATECYVTFRYLLQTDLADMRESMDNVEEDEVKKTQGAIRYVKRLLKELDPEGRKKPTVFDGGFGD